MLMNNLETCLVFTKSKENQTLYTVQHIWRIKRKIHCTLDIRINKRKNTSQEIKKKWREGG